MEVAGRVAVVTGSGGGGSGRAICKRIALDGGFVVVSDINEAGGAETIAQIEANVSGRAVYRRADVRIENDVRELIAFTEATFGGLDILVNNASGPEYRPDEPLEYWTEIVRTEVFGAMFGVRHAIDAMRRRGGGAIINVSSTSALYHGRIRAGGSPAYDAAKAAILHLTTGLRFLGEEGIRVNCLIPHWIASPGPKEYFESLTPREREERGVPEALITLDEMADAVLRCARDESLAGRAMVLWGGREPAFLPVGDPGYVFLEPD